MNAEQGEVLVLGCRDHLVPKYSRPDAEFEDREGKSCHPCGLTFDYSVTITLINNACALHLPACTHT